jgi:hypothetical protein
MCNCNQKRTMYRNNNTIEKANKGMVKFKLTQTEPIIVNGDITGRMYVFRNMNDSNWVDKRDASSLHQIQGLQILG